MRKGQTGWRRAGLLAALGFSLSCFGGPNLSSFYYPDIPEDGEGAGGRDDGAEDARLDGTDADTEHPIDESGTGDAEVPGEAETAADADGDVPGDAPIDELGVEDAPSDEAGAGDADVDTGLEVDAEWTADGPVDELGEGDAPVDDFGAGDAPLDELGAEDADGPVDEPRLEDAPVDELGAEDAEIHVHCPAVCSCPGDMVCVPCGPFVMGSDPGEGDGDEMPEHVVTLSAYCIDRTEVTVTAYLACVGAGGCGSPHGPHGTDDYPVGNVTWLQAAGYCSFAGKRLPTEAEWEKAARGGCELAGDAASCDGPDERTWPWGDDAPTCDRAVFLGCGTGTARVGSVSPLGDSPYGLQDMAGNAQEWVADYYDAAWYGGCGEPCVDPTGPATSITNMRVARGGDRSGSAAAVRAANRYWFARDFADYDLGFRCAAAAP